MALPALIAFACTNSICLLAVPRGDTRCSPEKCPPPNLVYPLLGVWAFACKIPPQSNDFLGIFLYSFILHTNQAYLNSSSARKEVCFGVFQATYNISPQFSYQHTYTCSASAYTYSADICNATHVYMKHTYIHVAQVRTYTCSTHVYMQCRRTHMR